MGEIAKFKKVDNDPVPDVVEHLKSALAKAERGELREIALIGSYGDGTKFTAYFCENILSVCGDLDYLKHNLYNTVDTVPTCGEGE